MRSFTPELDNLIGPNVWVRDAAGCLVTRAELAERVIEELDRGGNTRLSAVIQAIRGDDRKTFSKARVIELIEEHL